MYLHFHCTKELNKRVQQPFVISIRICLEYFLKNVLLLESKTKKTDYVFETIYINIFFFLLDYSTH